MLPVNVIREFITILMLKPPPQLLGPSMTKMATLFFPVPADFILIPSRERHLEVCALLGNY